MIEMFFFGKRSIQHFENCQVDARIQEVSEL